MTHNPAIRSFNTTRPPGLHRFGRSRPFRRRATSLRRHPARAARLAGVSPEAPGQRARCPPRRPTS